MIDCEVPRLVVDKIFHIIHTWDQLSKKSDCNGSDSFFELDIVELCIPMVRKVVNNSPELEFK
jgi:hypothetical protein